MVKFFEYFLKDDVGVIIVEWVVLIVGVVGFVIFVGLMVEIQIV